LFDEFDRPLPPFYLPPAAVIISILAVIISVIISIQ
jgi:hypothetical protein